MKANITEVLGMLKPALEFGCCFEISEIQGVLSLQLNTGAKSECVLKFEEDEVKAYCRYGVVETFEDFSDLVYIVHNCAHGRSFFNDGWLKVFKSMGMSDPRGNF